MTQNPLNKYLQPMGSPVDGVTNAQTKHVPWEFGVRQGIQVKKIRASNQTIRTFQQQAIGTFAFGTVGNGGTLTLTSTLSPNPPHIADPLFAVPYAGIFLGTSATGNGQIYPILGTANGTQFPLQAGLDFWVFNGTAPEWRAYVINNSGNAATIGFNILWQYMWFNNGTVS